MKLNQFNSLSLTALVLLFLNACNKNLEQDGKFTLNTQANTPAVFSGNLIFNEEGYNQFKKDLSDPEHAPSLKKLFEETANEALTIQPTAFSSLYPSESQKTAAYGASLRDSKFIKALALQSLATADAALRAPYLKKAAQILKAWAKINTASWHRPNETALFGLYEGYSVLRGQLSQTDRDTIDLWIRKRATVGPNNFKTKSASPNDVNNWEGQRLSFLLYSGYILQDANLISLAKSEYQAFLDVYLHSEGKTQDYKHRDALVYHSYGLWSIAPFLQAVSANEGQAAVAKLVNSTNKIGIKLEDAIRFWEPYLCGLYKDEFKNSAFASERAGTRRGRYKPAGDLYVIDKLVAFFPQRLSPYFQLLQSNSSRFDNLDRYIALQNRSTPEQDSPTVQLFKHCNFGNLSGTLRIGGYTTDKLILNGISDNDVSALKIPADRRVILYDGNFTDSLTAGGESRSFIGNIDCLYNIFNDKTSSVIVINN